jgi:hypothetical protein
MAGLVPAIFIIAGLASARFVWGKPQVRDGMLVRLS